MSKRFRIGMVGLEPQRSWGATAHLPALAGLKDDFELVGVANRSAESSARAAAAYAIPRGFASVEELVTSPDVDIVAVTVKVPHHHAIVSAAIAAGKHVYCEWPLGNGLQEAVELAAMAQARGVVAVIGTQSLFSPEIVQLRGLLAQGHIGEVLSTTLIGTGGRWGAEIEAANHYVLDRSNGATLLSIPVGHVLAAFVATLGPVEWVSATLANRRTDSRDKVTGERVPMSAPDQVLVQGALASGATFSLHYRGGAALANGFLWEIHGADGELRVQGPLGHAQLAPLSLSGGRNGEGGAAPIALTPALAADAQDGPVAGNVRRLYAAMAQDLRTGTRTAPRFEDAVAIHHILDAIERSAETGCRVSVSAA
jgi:predicted dehydrogenase